MSDLASLHAQKATLHRRILAAAARGLLHDVVQAMAAHDVRPETVRVDLDTEDDGGHRPFGFLRVIAPANDGADVDVAVEDTMDQFNDWDAFKAFVDALIDVVGRDGAFGTENDLNRLAAGMDEATVPQAVPAAVTAEQAEQHADATAWSAPDLSAEDGPAFRAGLPTHVHDPAALRDHLRDDHRIPSHRLDSAPADGVRGETLHTLHIAEHDGAVQDHTHRADRYDPDSVTVADMRAVSAVTDGDRIVAVFGYESDANAYARDHDGLHKKWASAAHGTLFAASVVFDEGETGHGTRIAIFDTVDRAEAWWSSSKRLESWAMVREGLVVVDADTNRMRRIGPATTTLAVGVEDPTTRKALASDLLAVGIIGVDQSERADTDGRAWRITVSPDTIDTLTDVAAAYGVAPDPINPDGPDDLSDDGTDRSNGGCCRLCGTSTDCCDDAWPETGFCCEHTGEERTATLHAAGVGPDPADLGMLQISSTRGDVVKFGYTADDADAGDVFTHAAAEAGWIGWDAYRTGRYDTREGTIEVASDRAEEFSAWARRQVEAQYDDNDLIEVSGPDDRPVAPVQQDGDVRGPMAALLGHPRAIEVICKDQSALTAFAARLRTDGIIDADDAPPTTGNWMLGLDTSTVEAFRQALADHDDIDARRVVIADDAGWLTAVPTADSTVWLTQGVSPGHTRAGRKAAIEAIKALLPGLTRQQAVNAADGDMGAIDPIDRAAVTVIVEACTTGVVTARSVVHLAGRLGADARIEGRGDRIVVIGAAGRLEVDTTTGWSAGVIHRPGRGPAVIPTGLPEQGRDPLRVAKRLVAIATDGQPR